MNDPDAFSCAIVRVRPAAIAAGGLSNDRLRDVAASLLPGTEVIQGPTTTFQVDPVISPFNQDVVGSLTRLLVSSLDTHDALILDVNFDRTAARYAVIDILLYQAMILLPDELIEGRRIVVLVEQLPARTDCLAMLADDVRFVRSIVVLDAAGRSKDTSVDGWLAGTEVANMVRVDNRELREHVSALILRRRGVFATSRPEYSTFLYSAAACTDKLATLLSEYFADHDVSFVLFDADTEDWFEDAVKAACLQTERDIQAYAIEDLTSTANQDQKLATVRQNALREIRDPDNTFCVVMPMYKTGRRMTELRGLWEQQGRWDPLLLTIMCDPPAGSTVTDHDYYSSVRIGANGRSVEVDYFAKVEMELLRQGDWRVVAAELNGEVEEHIDSWVSPSQVGLWSMFVDYGAKKEYSVPKSRSAIASFPQMRELNQWDSLWLAEAVIRCAQRTLGCARERILVVTPDERTAARRIAEAVEKILPVAVAKVKRAVLTGHQSLPEKVRQLIQANANLRIVLLDESTVTYTTFGQLDRVLHTTIGRVADLCAAVVELPSSETDTERPKNLVSLCRWQPLRLEPRT